MEFEWQHIQFEDGSNPYICTSEKAFKYMKRKYKLIKIKEGFWMAEARLKGVKRNEIN